MTDEQIIKALECCCKITHCERDCNNKKDCVLLHLHEVIYLINRQKAEIEKLNIELKAMRGAANSYKAEFERLEKELSKKEEIIKNLCEDN